MFFAGRGKQSHHKENSEDALTNEGSHNALAQLSVSRRPCKAKARWVAQASCLCYLRRIIRFRFSITSTTDIKNRRQRRGRVMIETRRCGITITRGGPDRKTQRVERSVRSRSAFCRHLAVFRADFLHTEGYTVVALV